jgi:uncharacterized protein YjbJ (UPF0337 family)
MNPTTLKGNWNEIKGKVRERWGRLTNNDLEQIQGRSEQLLGKLQRAYGLTKDEAQRQVEAFEEDCECGSRDESAMEREENQTRATAGAGLSPDETDDEPRYSDRRSRSIRDDE